jgi:hypothetical protein
MCERGLTRRHGVSVFFGGELILTADPAFVGVDDGGSWNVGMNPNGSLESEEPEVIADYDFADFELTAPPEPPEPPKPPAPEPEPAKPAAPVVAKRTFTG